MLEYAAIQGVFNMIRKKITLRYLGEMIVLLILLVYSFYSFKNSEFGEIKEQNEIPVNQLEVSSSRDIDKILTNETVIDANTITVKNNEDDMVKAVVKLKIKDDINVNMLDINIDGEKLEKKDINSQDGFLTMTIKIVELEKKEIESIKTEFLGNPYYMSKLDYDFLIERI